MENLEWLKKVKKADDDFNKLHNFNIDRLVGSDEGNEYRKAKALEIIAEELIDIKGELNLIASNVIAIKNLQ